MAKITIFGLAGTGTSTVGRMLAEKLDCAFFSTGGIFREKAALAGVPIHDFDKIAEEDESIDREVDLRVAQLGKIHENLVLESRLGWYFVPDSFKVKFICDDAERFSRVARRDNLSLEDAVKNSLSREKSHSERFNKLYGMEDYGADEHFDFIIDTTHSRAHEVVDIICSKINQD